jgi:hypothetical protein
MILSIIFNLIIDEIWRKALLQSLKEKSERLIMDERLSQVAFAEYFD